MLARTLRWFAFGAGYLSAFLLLVRLSAEFQTVPGISVWYPAAGLGFALLLTGGLRMLPLYCLGTGLAQYLIWQTPFFGPLAAVTASLAFSYGTATFLLRRFWRRPNLAFSNQVDMLAFVIVAMVGSLMAAVTFNLSLWSFGREESDALIQSIFQFWTGDCVGIMTATPFLAWVVLPQLAPPRPRPLQENWWITAWRRKPNVVGMVSEVAAQILVLLLVLALVFLSRQHLGDIPLFFCLLPQIWITIRHGLIGASIGAVFLSLGAAAGFHLVELNVLDILQFQTYTWVSVASNLILGQSVESRRQSAEVMRRAATVAANVHDAVIVTDLQGTITYWNRGAERIYGWSAEEAVGQSVYHFVPNNQPEELIPLRQRIADGELIERVWAVYRKDGSKVWIDARISRLDNRSGEPIGMLGVSHDATDRVETQQDLFAAEEKYHLLFSAIHDSLIICDPRDDSIIEVNPAAVRAYGYAVEELIGMPLRKLRVAVDELPIHQGLRMAGSMEWHRRRDETVFPVEVSYAKILIHGEYRDCAVVRDVTDRLQAQEEAFRRQEDLAHAQRVGTMGQLATGIAHELGQPLASISNLASGCVRRLRYGEVDTVSLSEKLTEISAHAIRAGEIVKRMRDFIQKRKTQRMATDINAATKSAVRMLSSELRNAAIDLRLDLDSDVPTIFADPIQIEQVVFNLLRNAIDALRDFPPDRPRQITINTGQLTNGHVRLAVADNGHGINEKRAEHIFEPFVTTKDQGMGLGLSISRSIIEAHGGELRVASTPGQGATFTCVLPTEPVP